MSFLPQVLVNKANKKLQSVALFPHLACYPELVSEKFLEGELERELATLRAVEVEVGHRFHEAVWMIKLVIEQFRAELNWLRGVMTELPHRATATNPARVSKNL